MGVIGTTSGEFGTPSATGGGGGTTSPLTTKGDIFGFDTANNRIPVGTDGTPLIADSAQTLGVGYATRDLNMNNVNVLNAKSFVTGQNTAPGSAESILISDSVTISTAIGPSTLHLNEARTISTGQSFALCGPIKVTSNWTVNGAILNLGFINITGTFQGNTPPSNGYIMYFAPNYSIQGTTSILAGLRVTPSIASGATVTKYIGVAIDGPALGGTVTTNVGLDIGVNSTLGGSTIWAMNIGFYNSYYNGLTTFGNNTVPTYAIHLRGGGNATVNSAANAIGFDISTTEPTTPASNCFTLSDYAGSGGSNKYIMFKVNDGGTTRYITANFRGATGTISWTVSTTVPT